MGVKWILLHQSILEQKQSVKVTEKKVEEKEVEKTFTVPIDRVDISDEARALSKSSETASNIDGGNESIELRQKEALLATYQTQLTTLQSENM